MLRVTRFGPSDLTSLLWERVTLMGNKHHAGMSKRNEKATGRLIDKRPDLLSLLLPEIYDAIIVRRGRVENLREEKRGGDRP